MTKPLQGSHFRRLHDLIMGMASIKKATKNPSKSKSRLLKGNKTAKKPISSSSVKVLALKKSSIGGKQFLDYL